jgi:carotenoid cleavage dioxygenase
MTRFNAANLAIGRRTFMSGAIGAAAGIGTATSKATLAVEPPPATMGSQPGAPLSQTNPRESQGNQPAFRTPSLFRVEMDIADCEIEGKVPTDLNGVFYRVGPDAQYPLHPLNIPFDGEGHVSLFKIGAGHVSYKSRYVRNQRYKAQEAAQRILFPLYRNPYLDDPSAKGLSRGTANTHIIYYKNLLLALKEDSPPVAMHPLTLETLDDYYTFDGQLESKTFTAHPKIDSENGNMVAFGYEAKGFATDDVNIFEYTPQGRRIWNAWIKVPYIGMLHDFAVTPKHVIFYVIPLSIDPEQMKSGGIHWSWDGGKPTYFGVLRRGGDGKDIRWFKGPERSATHVMGAFEDGNRVYVDVEMSLFNPFPFMPFRDGQTWNPIQGASRITRLSVDLSNKSVKGYEMEVMYPNHLGALPRQDDRYNTAPYRIGFLPCPDPDPQDKSKRPSQCWARFDHQTRKAQLYRAGENINLAEMVFAPRGKNAPEGSGYLLGVATHMNEGGRSDLVILDAEHLDEGALATVKLPTRIVGQIHGDWVPADALPKNPT